MGKIRKEKIKEFLIGIILFTVICISFYLYVFREYNPIYGINDDWTLYMVISGSYLGYPEPHVNYMMYPLAWMLCQLYSITSNIPWYGIMLQGFVALCGFFLFFRIYYFFEKGMKRIVFSVLGLLLFLCSHLGIILLIQYTQVGAICAATAIFWFLSANTKEADWKQYLIKNIPTILLATIALNIRENTLYMALPIAGMVFLAKWYAEDRKLSQEAITRYAGFVLCLGVFLGGTVIAHKIAYSSPEWKEYVEVNNIWTRGVDYYGFPAYEEIEEIVTNNGMTREDYEIGLFYQTLYRGDMEYSEFLKVITDVAKEKYDEHNPLGVKWKEANKAIKSWLTRESIRPLNLVAVLLFVMVLCLVICSKNKYAMTALLCYLFGRFFAWYYLLFAGRFPERIAQGLFSMDMMTLLGFILYFKPWKYVKFLKLKSAQMAGSIFVAVTLMVFLWNGLQRMEQITSHVETFQDRWYGLKQYCSQHLENRYFLSGGSQTLYYFSDHIFETDSIGKVQNFYTNTNFDSPSPNYYDMMGAEYGTYLGDDMIEQENNYWIYEKGYFTEDVSIVKFYQSEYENFSYELVDVFNTETSSFEVYRFTK